MFGVVFYAPRALLLIVLVMGCSCNFAMKQEIFLGDDLGKKILLPMNRDYRGQCVELRKDMDIPEHATLHEILWGDAGHKTRSASQKAYKTARPETVSGPDDGCVRNQPSLDVAAWKPQSGKSALQMFDPTDVKTSCGKINVRDLKSALELLCSADQREHLRYPEYQHSKLNLDLDASTMKCLAKGQIEVECPYYFKRHHDEAGNCAIANNASNSDAQETAAEFNPKRDYQVTDDVLNSDLGLKRVEPDGWEKIFFQPMFRDASGQLVLAINSKNSGPHCAWHFCVEDIKKLRSDENKKADKFIERSWFTNWHASVKVDKGALPTKPRHSSLAASKNYKPFLLACLVGSVILFAMYKCKHQFESTEDDLPRVIFFFFFTVTMVMRLVG
jgi:hypothetical protein